MDSQVPAISVAGLAKTYGEVQALAGIDFEVARGEILGLLGPNGSGKTTTVGLLSTLQRPSSGTAEICGYDVVGAARRVRELISLTGQYASINDALSTVENLTLFGRLTGLRGRTLRSRVDALVEQFELEGERNRRVKALSGGMRRRVDIASALITRPEVLFLDEPTTGLDPRSRAAVWETVAGLRDEGITVLLTTQYLEEADRLADTIVVLNKGSVVASGTPGTLKTAVGAAMCEMSLAERADAPRAAEVLSGLSFEIVDDAADSTSAHPAVILRAPDGTATVRRVIDALDEAQIGVLDIGLRQPSMDEVFLQLTGTVDA